MLNWGLRENSQSIKGLSGHILVSEKVKTHFQKQPATYLQESQCKFDWFQLFHFFLNSILHFLLFI